ncbi:LysM peptidoglycan-binding domain-containing protein [Pediococcus acidilactici]|uniref:GH25 family lysozyme n=1 Tax=Pediococcus acidilactici TaxID=1254 RepID=UPI00132C08CF|nr:GH25 family lysozyme [Pediococcus acidilactici]KAF0365228.1 LysM peptidoglycan-binding domain-containing protein [Pediococcus acidilactici]KAF0369306.1 LysM peptidoglycan-binding domain-containing protein [Pediococcus acidilactici]KAF0417799.1 LysM peptidoglycan-binding domain-containing protein [Pediococcus acidilactici]KAF0420947.1 LysM peptidoglycan-binding domain-containing protein [Pediococcus acidilactici]KAF0474968.1 LysM peptidoglycan-binding domain-containing protein [Pediococcus a
MNKRKLKVLILMVSAIFVAFLMGNVTSQASTSREQGVDWSKFQGNSGVFGYSSDKFVFSQAGGFYGGTNIPQTTYATQVASAKQAGKRVHTYLWDGVGGNMFNAKAMMAYYLPRVKTPKGSIVALDYEDGASDSVTANTNAILAQMKLIKDAGYTPMLYGYKAYLSDHVDVASIVRAHGNCLWLAEYPDYLVRTCPNYNYFPSMNGVAIFQFTSMYKAGGLDGDVDLTGITKSGYTTVSKKQAQTNVKKAQAAKKAAFKVVKYNQSGVFYPNRTLAVRYTDSDKVSQVATYHKGESVIYNAVIIEHDYVWARYTRSNGLYGFIKLGVTNGPAYGKRVTYQPVSHTYYTVRYGDSWWTIAQRNGLSMTTLASQNGKTIYTTIYPGQRLVVR